MARHAARGLMIGLGPTCFQKAVAWASWTRWSGNASMQGRQTASPSMCSTKSRAATWSPSFGKRLFVALEGDREAVGVCLCQLHCEHAEADFRQLSWRLGGGGGSTMTFCQICARNDSTRATIKAEASQHGRTIPGFDFSIAYDAGFGKNFLAKASYLRRGSGETMYLRDTEAAAGNLSGGFLRKRTCVETIG
jgi:hypothetical protein